MGAGYHEENEDLRMENCRPRPFVAMKVALLFLLSVHMSIGSGVTELIDVGGTAQLKREVSLLDTSTGEEPESKASDADEDAKGEEDKAAQKPEQEDDTGGDSEGPQKLEKEGDGATSDADDVPDASDVPDVPEAEETQATKSNSSAAMKTKGEKLRAIVTGLVKTKVTESSSTKGL